MPHLYRDTMNHDSAEEIIRTLASCSVASLGDDPEGRSIYLSTLKIGVIVHAALKMRRDIESSQDEIERAKESCLPPDTLVEIQRILPDLERYGCSTPESKCVHSPSETGRGWGGLCPAHRAIAVLKSIQEAFQP